jgi:hypothetical protein
MTAPRQRPAAISDGKQAAPADTTRCRPDPISVSPGTGLVNTDTYGQGWLFEAEIDPAALKEQLAGLMDADAYQTLAGA